MTQEKLQTRDQLGRRIQLPDSSCPVCNMAAEAHFHLFFDCILSQALLQKINSWLGRSDILTNLSQWLICLRSTNSLKYINAVKIAVAQAVVYEIWINRNLCIFCNTCHSVSWCLQQIQTTIRSRVSLYYRRMKTDSDRAFYNRLLV